MKHMQTEHLLEWNMQQAKETLRYVTDSLASAREDLVKAQMLFAWVPGPDVPQVVIDTVRVALQRWPYSQGLELLASSIKYTEKQLPEAQAALEKAQAALEKAQAALATKPTLNAPRT